MARESRMRIPFDLLIALIGLEALKSEFYVLYGHLPSRGASIAVGAEHGGPLDALVALLALWLIAWLVHEGLARGAEWRTRWGYLPAGLDPYGVRPLSRHASEAHARGVWIAQAFCIALFFAFTWYYRWPMQAMGWPEWLGLHRVLSRETCDGLGASAVIGCLTDLGPFLVMLLLSWVPKRRLAEHVSRRPVSLRRFISFEARLTLLPCVLWLAMYLLTDLLRLFNAEDAFDGTGPAPWLAVLLPLVILGGFAVLILPWLVVWVWQCKPLPDGPLKDRLEALMQKSGVKARAILSWGPKGTGLANAAVLGPWAPMRYILISPGLAETLDLDECEAVLAHELGHAKHGHLSLLLLFVVVLSAVSNFVLRLADDWPAWEQAVLFVVLLGVWLRVFFGAISRSCEREADLASAELVGTPRPLISALEKIGTMAGGIRDLYSWHHGSIAQRVAYLERDAQDPQACAQYHARMRRLRLGFAAIALLALGIEMALAWHEAEAAPAKTERATFRTNADLPVR
ncbi:MAG: M48 family metalloprotease [Planctomycetes bacterium]|nr:M48 family metalloprotease [Planctomycetota bacterium]